MIPLYKVQSLSLIHGVRNQDSICFSRVQSGYNQEETNRMFQYY